MAHELRGKVEKWLAQTGYPLEMRISQKVHASRLFDSWAVQVGEHYLDPDSGIVREIDVRSLFFVQSAGEEPESCNVWVELVLECKSAANPWIVFKDVQSEDRAPSRAVSFGDARRLTIYNSSEESFRRYILALDATTGREEERRYSNGYAVAEAFKGPNSKDAAYSATRQALSAARYVARSEYFYDKTSSEVALVIPVVVTSGPLFEAYLDPQSNNLVCQPVEQSALYVPDERSTRRPVLIVTENGFDTLLADLEAFETRAKQFMGVAQ